MTEGVGGVNVFGEVCGWGWGIGRQTGHRSCARVTKERQAREVVPLAAGEDKTSPDSARDRDETTSRALPEVPERKSGNAGRRGGLATRAATTPPEASPEIRQNPAEIPAHLAGRWIKTSSSPASFPVSGHRPSPLRGRIRCGFPVLRVEWPGPWEIIAERRKSSKWWWGMDSNHRTHRGQIYSLMRLATSLPHLEVFRIHA